MILSWIKEKVSRVASVVRRAYPARKPGVFRKVLPKTKRKPDDDRGFADAFAPGTRPKFPPTLVAACGFEDVPERAFYGWTKKRPL